MEVCEHPLVSHGELRRLLFPSVSAFVTCVDRKVKQDTFLLENISSTQVFWSPSTSTTDQCLDLVQNTSLS